MITLNEFLILARPKDLQDKVQRMEKELILVTYRRKTQIGNSKKLRVKRMNKLESLREKEEVVGEAVVVGEVLRVLKKMQRIR